MAKNNVVWGARDDDGYRRTHVFKRRPLDDEGTFVQDYRKDDPAEVFFEVAGTLGLKKGECARFELVRLP